MTIIKKLINEKKLRIIDRFEKKPGFQCTSDLRAFISNRHELIFVISFLAVYKGITFLLVPLPSPSSFKCLHFRIIFWTREP